MLVLDAESGKLFVRHHQTAYHRQAVLARHFRALRFPIGTRRSPAEQSERSEQGSWSNSATVTTHLSTQRAFLVSSGTVHKRTWHQCLTFTEGEAIFVPETCPICRRAPLFAPILSARAVLPDSYPDPTVVLGGLRPRSRGVMPNICSHQWLPKAPTRVTCSAPLLSLTSPSTLLGPPLPLRLSSRTC